MRWIEWLEADVSIARWLLIVFVVTMLFEIITVVYAIMRRGNG